MSALTLMMRVAAEGGFGPGAILESLPRDPAAIFVYVILFGAVGLGWWANRASKRASDRAASSEAEPDAATSGEETARR